MKLLVFAHTPPPHHGQSFMVELMITGLRDRGWRVVGGPHSSMPASGGTENTLYHVNARVSDDLQDVGGIRPGKMLRLLKYCVQALWYRLRFGADTLYYIPAPAKRSAVVRDWIVMALLRLWFRSVVFHWHAFGLGHWATGTVEHPEGATGPGMDPPDLFPKRLEPIARGLTRWLVGGAGVSMVLTAYNRRDAELLKPAKVTEVPNGLPDPCPDFEESIWPVRQRRHALALGRLDFAQSGPGSGSSAPRYSAGDIVRGLKAPLRNGGNAEVAEPGPSEDASLSEFPPGKRQPVPVLFLAHCSREKGLFDALEAVAATNELAASSASALAGPSSNERGVSGAQADAPRFHLTVAGGFMDESERRAFDARICQSDLQLPQPDGTSAPAVRYAGFISGPEKDRVLRESDILLFPTKYPGETFGLVIAEAMAYGLGVVTTGWRGIAGIGHGGAIGVTPVGSVPELAKRLVEQASADTSVNRALFLRRASVDAHLDACAAALRAAGGGE